MDLSKAPEGAQRVLEPYGNWLRCISDQIQTWESSKKEWYTIPDREAARVIWNKATSIYLEPTPEEDEVEAFSELGKVTTSVGTKDYESSRSDGSTASYYELPPNTAELQHLISHRNMNSQIGEIFRACYRYGMASHSDQLRDAKKILFYAKAEVERLESIDG